MTPANMIHRTAIVDPTAVLGDGNFIGPFCMIGPNVKIGNGNMFVAYCSVGLPAEHRDYWEKYGQVEIGNDNVIREFTTINSSTKGITRMGDKCVMLRGSHLSHDSILEDGVNLSCDVLVGGESHIMKHANIGLGAIMHQRSLIGSYSMVGMGTVVTKNSKIIPGRIYIGSPATYLKDNVIGLQRANVDGPGLEVEIQRYRALKGLR